MSMYPFSSINSSINLMVIHLPWFCCLYAWKWLPQWCIGLIPWLYLTNQQQQPDETPPPPPPIIPTENYQDHSDGGADFPAPPSIPVSDSPLGIISASKGFSGCFLFFTLSHIVFTVHSVNNIIFGYCSWLHGHFVQCLYTLDGTFISR